MAEMVEGLLTPVDRQVMTTACETWARWVAATQQVTKLGVLVAGDRGLVKNPAVQIARDAEATLARCWAELGLSPAARGRLSMPRPEHDDLESLLGPRTSR